MRKNNRKVHQSDYRYTNTLSKTESMNQNDVKEQMNRKSKESSSLIIKENRMPTNKYRGPNTGRKSNLYFVSIMNHPFRLES